MIANNQIGLARVDEAGRIALMSRDVIEQGLRWTWTPQRVLRGVRDSSTNTIVARDGRTIVGFAIMLYGDDDAHLALLAVEPARRRQGIASALLAWLEVTARTAGLRRIKVETRADNHEARAMYRKFAYREMREILGYYQGIDDAVALAKTLRNDPPEPPPPATRRHKWGWGSTGAT